MLSALLGVAVIALPSGVITARYLNELKRFKSDNSDNTTEDGNMGIKGGYTQSVNK